MLFSSLLLPNTETNVYVFHFSHLDDCPSCIDRSFDPKELVDKVCHDSVDFGKRMAGI